jgi:hypothetical protein
VDLIPARDDLRARLEQSLVICPKSSFQSTEMDRSGFPPLQTHAISAKRQ